jgi:hypothetical protein
MSSSFKMVASYTIEYAVLRLSPKIIFPHCHGVCSSQILVQILDTVRAVVRLSKSTLVS